jgi:DNA-binding MarR family transcriptional regulator
MLTMEVLQQFRLIYGSMRQYFRLVEEHCGLPGSQMWILQEVHRSEGVGIVELAMRMGIHQSTCSLLVDRLVARDFISKTRQRNDQRRIGLALLPAGIEVLGRLPGPAEGILPAALAALPDVVLKTLQINLDELIRNLPVRDEAFSATPLAELIGNAE